MLQETKTEPQAAPTENLSCTPATIAQVPAPGLRHLEISVSVCMVTGTGS